MIYACRVEHGTWFLTSSLVLVDQKMELVEKKLDAGIIDYDDTEPDEW